jgi:hypothetical protein
VEKLGITGIDSLSVNKPSRAPVSCNRRAGRSFDEGTASSKWAKFYVAPGEALNMKVNIRQKKEQQLEARLETVLSDEFIRFYYSNPNALLKYIEEERRDLLGNADWGSRTKLPVETLCESERYQLVVTGEPARRRPA